MIILIGLKWTAIVVCSIVCLILVLIGLFALAVLTEQLLYKLSRYRTLRALGKVHALKAKFANAIQATDLSNPLMRGFSIPLSRFDRAVERLAHRSESLEADNDKRRGPHTRREWRHLRRDVKAVLRRGKQLDYFTEAADARDGVWPFVADYSAIYADENYAGRNPYSGVTSVFAGQAELLEPPPTARRPLRNRNWGVGGGAMDEEVMPSAAERSQAQAALLQQVPGVTVLRPAAAKADSPAGIYDAKARIIPFKKRAGALDVKA